MIEFDIEPGSFMQTGRGISPTHKITLKRGTETSVFWYLQEPGKGTSTDPLFDHGELGQLYAHAQALLVGDFLYFSAAKGKDYHLQRVASGRFTLKSLN